MYNDPSGEVFFLIPLVGYFWSAVIVGAVIGAASYLVSSAIMGQAITLKGFLKSTLWGGISGAVTFGIGSIFSVAGSTVLTATGTAIKEAVGGVGLAIVQAGTHAVAQGVMSLMQGGTFQQAFWSGALGSLGASAFGAIASDFANKAVGQIVFGAVSGGIGAELSGGNFWQGAVIGGIVAGLNHAMHRMDTPFDEKTAQSQQPGEPWDLDGDGRISLDEANNWYRNGGGKSITLDASKIDLNSADTSKWQKGGKYGVQTLFNSKEGRVLGNITVEYLGNNQVKILPDTYNFEMHGNPLSVRNPIKNYGTWIRNTATILGLLKAGSGMQYKINFSGINTIKSR